MKMLVTFDFLIVYNYALKKLFDIVDKWVVILHWSIKIPRPYEVLG